MCFAANSGTELEIEILADGTVKVTTGSLAGPEHMKAEQFMAFLARELGGEVKVAKREHTRTHSHAHEGVHHGLKGGLKIGH